MIGLVVYTAVAAAFDTHSITTDPLLPAFRAASVVYGGRSGPDQLTVGGWFSRADATATRRLPYPGEVESLAAIVGYRRYLWRGAHGEGWLMPGRTRYRTDDRDRVGFTLYTEARLGWRLQPRRIPFVLDVQWPVGGALVNTNRPASFAEVDRRDPVFVIPWPNLWVGVAWPPRA